MSALDQALGYSARWPVFPTNLVRRANGKLDKVPCIKQWGEAASRDLAQIESWWHRWPDAVISIPTGKPSGVIVLDIDVKDGRNGFDRLGELGKAILPETPIAHTASGGVHLYFARTEIEIRNSAGERGLGLGLDIRGDGGQVVLPSTNSGYWWDPHWNFDTVEPMSAPAWLGHRQHAHKVEPANGHGFSPQTALRESCDRIRCAADGQKHDVLNREAFRIGTLVAASLLRRNEAWNDIEAATAALIAISGADRSRTWKDLTDAFDDDLVAPRRAAQ
jgi:hypothetical protein